MSVAWKRHGSKLNAVAKRLREIRKQDPKAKALVFVQWVDLEGKMWRALEDHGVPYLRLSGGARDRTRLSKDDGAVLRSFQNDDRPDAPFVLVLSLQRAASGTNLTAANHVLFVHPMNAESVHGAAAYERQALARVRRIGQTRHEVHVWRFVTKQTVEEHIWKLHREAPVDVDADRIDQH
jgi:SNF2 family DNA or RNA helicase